MKENIPSGLKSKEEILDKSHWNYVCEKGISSIHTETFPSAYKEQAMIAMEEYAKQFQHPPSTFVQVEELAKDYADNKVPNPSPNDAPYYTTGDRWDDIYQTYKDAFTAASPKGKEEEAVEFAEWLGQQVLEYDKGNWFTPNMEKSSINNSYRVTYENPVTTKQLYSLFKQSKETTG